MAAVLMTCPVTGQPSHTGRSMDAESFKTAVFDNAGFGCDQCGQIHTIVKEEAYLDS